MSENPNRDYHTQTIEIVINKEDPLFERLTERATESGMTVEQLIETLMLVSLYHDLERKLK